MDKSKIGAIVGQLGVKTASSSPSLQKGTTSTSSTVKKSSSAPKLSKAEKDYQSQLKKAIESSYSQGQEFLTGQEQRLQALQPQIEEQVTATFEAQRPQIEQLSQRQLQQITGQQEETRAQRESALAQARRQFQEGTQRAQALFGGVSGSSAGLAQSELLAREQARQMGATQRQAQTQIAGLTQNIRDIEATTAQQLRQIDIDKQQAILKARDTFRQQLDAINSQRFQLAQDKVNRQLQALQDFNARRRQLEDYYTQQQDAVANARAQAELGLQTYEQQLRLAQRFAPAPLTTSPLSNLAGLNLDALNRTNPQQARDLANQIAQNPTLQQQFRANVVGNTLQFLTPEGNLGTISLQ